MKSVVVIPWRDRNRDPLRPANLQRVKEHWAAVWPAWTVRVESDGGSEDDQFNRSRAYNRAIRAVGSAEVFVFSESDMLVSYEQVHEAVALAAAQPGLVIPFTQYRGLSPEDSELVRKKEKKPSECVPIIKMDRDSTGAINVVSRITLEMVGGYDECFTGSWYDDTAMFRAFRFVAGEPRWVQGPAYHLFHLPGHTGEHLTDEDRAATAANQQRWERYKQASTPEGIKALVMEGR